MQKELTLSDGWSIYLQTLRWVTLMNLIRVQKERDSNPR